MTWMPSYSGAPIDLVDPPPQQVNFTELAWSLAQTNRYAGHPVKPVSVGLHLLIGLDIAPESLKALWLLHDGHESRTGDQTTPAKEALLVYAERLFGAACASQLAAVHAAFEGAHAETIHTAAGLAMPTATEAAALKQIDFICLATERRQFMHRGTRAWAIDRAGIEPAPKAPRWLAPDVVADKLNDAFHRYLPTLRGQSRRAIR